MLKRMREWLIFKLVGDQPVIMNIDVQFKNKEYSIRKPIIYKE